LLLRAVAHLAARCKDRLHIARKIDLGGLAVGGKDA